MVDCFHTEVEMIDIHIHILQGMDDGAMDIDEALTMLAKAELHGVTDVIATPHSWAVDDKIHIERAVKQLNKAASEIGIKAKVHGGCEFNVMRGEAIDALGDRLKDLTLAGSRYLLTEFSNSTGASIIYRCVERIVGKGLVPIIAHPERYSVMWDDLEPMRKAKGLGAFGQISMGDLIGRGGTVALKAALSMLDEGLCQICATDAHTPDKLEAYMAAVGAAEARYGKEGASRLFTDNPSVVLNNGDPSQIKSALN